MRGRKWMVLVALAAIGCNRPAPEGVPALSADREALYRSLVGGALGVQAREVTSGWEFTVSEPIVVTHLGLFDYMREGFAIDHAIGIYRVSDSTLLTSGGMSRGASDVLVGEFRYVDVPDVALDVGESYVIAYYSYSKRLYERDSGARTVDCAATDRALFSIAPVIIRGPIRKWSEESGGLVMPTESDDDADEDGTTWIGPSFLYVEGDSPSGSPKSD